MLYCYYTVFCSGGIITVTKRKSHLILSAVSLLLAMIMLLGASACGKSGHTRDEADPDADIADEIRDGDDAGETEAAENGTTAGEEETTASDGEETTAPDGEEETTVDGEEETTLDGEDTEGPTLFLGVNDFDFSKHDPDPSKWSKEEIIACYKAGMAKEDHADVQTDQKFQLTGDLPGSSALKKAVELAMKLASKPFGALPGGYWDLVPEDIKKADAHKEGKYIVINLYPKEQVDGPYGNEHEGSVGHVVNVVQGIDSFLSYVEDNFGIVKAHYEADSVKLTYKNAYAHVKIDSTTGKMTGGKWGYDIIIWLDNCGVLGVEFNDYTTSMKWECWYPVED